MTDKPAKRTRRRASPESGQPKAKPKKVLSSSSELSKTFEGLRSEYGFNVVRRAKDVTVPNRISTGVFVLDFATLGGIPESRVSMVVGHRHSGKSLIANKTIASVQRSSMDGYPILIDVEGTHDSTWSQKLGVDLGGLYVAPCETGEMAVDIAEAVVESAESSLVVIDSLAALTPMTEIESTADDALVGIHARLIARMVRKVTAALIKERKRGHHVTVLFVNQFRCVDEDTLVCTGRGLLPIKDVRCGDVVHAPGGMVPVLATERVGSKSGVEVIAKGCPPIKMSNEHRHMVVGPAGRLVEEYGRNLKPGMWVATPAEPPTTERLPGIPDIHARFLGMYFADGCTTRAKGRSDYRVSFTEVDDSRRSIVAGVCQQLFSGKGSYRNPLITIGRYAVDLVDHYGIGYKGVDKSVPECILQGSKETVREFLRYASFDTHFFDRNTFFWTFETSEQCNTFASLLVQFGIHAQVVPARFGDKKYLSISSDDAVAYRDLIGFAEPVKQAKAQAFTKTTTGGRGKYDLVPNSILAAVLQEVRFLGVPKVSELPHYNALRQCAHKESAASRTRLLSFVEAAAMADDRLLSWVKTLSAFRYAEILSVEPTSIVAVDIEVDGGVFYANNQLTHNSKIGGFQKFGEPLSIPGGKALEYCTTLQFEMRNKENSGKDSQGVDVQTHNEHAFKITKNKLCQGPRTGEFVLNRLDRPDDRLREGDIDDAETVLAYAKKMGFYVGGGKKWTLDLGDDSYNFGKAAEAVKELRADPFLYCRLRDLLIQTQAAKQGMPEDFIKSIKSVPYES